MEISGFFSAILIGLVIGALARIIVPNSQPIGCLLTMIVGIVAAAAGAAIGYSQHWSFWLVLALQILIAAVIIAIFSTAVRPRN